MIFNMTEAEWDAVIAVHLKGTFNTIRAASIRMREQKARPHHQHVVGVGARRARASPTTPPPRRASSASRWSTANAMAKYGVTCNAIMPSGATRMIDSTPRGREVFESTGKWPSEQAMGTERDPTTWRRWSCSCRATPRPTSTGRSSTRSATATRCCPSRRRSAGWRATAGSTPEEVARQFKGTIGAGLVAPMGTGFGRTLHERPAEEWKDLDRGIRGWKAPTA